METYSRELKVVFLDWSETLSSSKFWEHLKQAPNSTEDLFARIQKLVFAPAAPLKHYLDPWMRGEFTAEQIVGKIADELQFDRAILLEELIESCQNMRFVSDEVPDLVQTIRSRGIKVVIATGNMDTFSRWTVPAMSLRDLFDDILNSYDLKCSKSDVGTEGRSLFFADFLERDSVLRGESMLIDDSKHLGPVVQSFGIEYRQIEPGVGLVAELKRILAS